MEALQICKLYENVHFAGMTGKEFLKRIGIGLLKRHHPDKFNGQSVAAPGGGGVNVRIVGTPGGPTTGPGVTAPSPKKVSATTALKNDIYSVAGDGVVHRINKTTEKKANQPSKAYQDYCCRREAGCPGRPTTWCTLCEVYVCPTTKCLAYHMTHLPAAQ